ncbi:MAG: hypothetical protein RBJ76_02440 [Stenomitos frigidus ULC029]
MLLKVQLSYDRTDDMARQKAYEQWRNNNFKNVSNSLMPDCLTEIGESQ